jgi:hypothetical protein
MSEVVERTVKYVEDGVVKEGNIEDAPEEHIHGVHKAPASPGPVKRYIGGQWMEIPFRWNRTEGRYEEDEAQAVPVR